MKVSAERFPYLLWRTATLIALGILLGDLFGCNRGFYRRQADEDVYSLVDCGSTDPRWPLPEFTIQPDPESRFFDPDCADYPPMPPDDPTSHELMQCVDGKQGWRHWYRDGHTPCVENPAWIAYLPFDEEGTVTLDRDGAVQTALLHSREYQRELEDLYLSALDVTFEQFRFDAQFFGGNSTFFTVDGPLRTGGPRSQLVTDTDLQLRRLMASGGELIVDAANSLVWQFAGPDSYNANTLLNFSLVQPLLRAGGRAVVLERLTDRERALLANIRQMERFRRGFYAQIVAGRSGVAGPARGGISLGAISGGGGGGGIGGCLRLLQTQVEIRNQQENVVALQDSVDRLEQEFYNSPDPNKTRLPLDLARQALFRGQGSLVREKAEYEDQLDTYKLTLGLPPDLKVKIEDPFLERFNLIDPALTATQNTVKSLQLELRQLEEGMPADYQAQVSTIQQLCADHSDSIQQDLERFAETLPERRKSLQTLSMREEIQRGEVDPGICNAEDLDVRFQDLNEDFTKLRRELENTLAELDPFQRDLPATQQDAGPARELLTDLVEKLYDQLLELALIQVKARLDSVTLVPVTLGPEEAFQIARASRRDWMNARAALVDTWRQIELAANDLQSSLDVVLQGDLDTTDNNPVRFRGTTGRLRVGLEFDAPLTRLSERNAYREALINYQQTRRAYYAFEDRVNQTLRNTIRRIQRNQLDFEINRQSVFVAATRVDLARLGLVRPPRPGESTQKGASTTAARDLVEALSSLLDAQNAFLGVWVEYEVQRMNLSLDLGTMELDERGMWIDPGPVTPSDTPNLEEEPEEVPPGIEELLLDLEIVPDRHPVRSVSFP